MIKPIVDYGRAPEQGRIRYGIKSNGYPKSITKFRFTSSDKVALTEVGEVHGGAIKPWKGTQYELLSDASEIKIVLPPDPLSIYYEHWQGSGCKRRCDGVTASIPVQTPDGADLVEVSCLCNKEGKLLCKPTTRLKVILPDVRFGGVWRLESKGGNAAEELPGMVDLIVQLQGVGLTHAEIALDQREGSGKKFVVPVLRLPVSMNQLAAKKAAELGAPTVLELGDGS